MGTHGSTMRASHPAMGNAATANLAAETAAAMHPAEGAAGTRPASERAKAPRRPASHAAPPPPRRRHLSRAAMAAVAACLALIVGVGSAWAYNYNKLDLTWYTDDRDASEFTIATAGQMQAFAALVNGDAVDVAGNPMNAVTFEGKTVKLANGVNLAFAGEFTPVGTKDNPFKGTFDGQGNTVGGLTITQGTSDIGLFGVTAEGSVLKGVVIDGSGSIKLTSDDAAFEDVGSLVGECGGRIEGCSSAAKVRIDHTKVDGIPGPVMKNVGGVAGSVKGSVSSTTFSGSLAAETPANAYKNAAGASVASVVENVGGVTGRFGGSLSGCTNAGTLLVVTSGKSGVDRFGSSVDAKSLYVGGVGGYGEGDVTDCHNTATLFTTSIAGATLADIGTNDAQQADGGADAMGGVVGSLRGIAMSGLGDNRGDPGLEEGAATLTLSDCSNTGYVSGLHTVGGIVGAQGSKTVVTRCVNGVAESDATSNVGHVRTTRWNKPAGGGICGQSWGTISYSRNHGQSENTKTGYYTAGICGMLIMHENQPEAAEIFACYSTGNVFCGGATASFYEGGIVGENDHGCYVHDNVFLYGTVSTHISTHDDANNVAVGRNYGTVANSQVVYETAKQAKAKNGICIKSGEAVGILNKLSANNGWTSYYFITKGANNGYPVLNGQATPDAKIDLSEFPCTVEYVGNAKYTAAYNPVPSLKVTVTIDGKAVKLTEGADYRVVADPSALDGNGICKGITNGKRPYQAGVEGIGNYSGAPSAKVAYGIDRGDFSECTVSVETVKWTGEPQNAPAISVVDAGGSVVDPKGYTTEVNGGKDCIIRGPYPVSATATGDGNYVGTATGTYTIESSDLYKDADVIGITYGNRVWYYDEEKTDLYEVIPADEQGNALPEGADLERDAQGLPYVVPQTYTNPDTGAQDVRTCYKAKDGRMLTVAEAKHKNADGSTVYGDMGVDFTGDAIEPACIGVLYPVTVDANDENWTYNPHLLYGVHEREVTAENNTKLDYTVQYGRFGDDIQRSMPRNVNATTSDDKPEASVVVYGNHLGNFRNYAYMDFKINRIAVTEDNLAVVQKKKKTLPYSAGARPAAPATSLKPQKGNVNAGVEVRYVPDPARYDANDSATYRVLDGANWKLEFDHATDADGNAIGDGQYAPGSKVYYTVVPTEACSLTGWTEKKVVEPFVVEGSTKVKLSNSIIKIEVDENATFALKNGGLVVPAMTITNTITGEQLVEGQDYRIEGGKVGYDEAAGRIRGKVQVWGQGAHYAGARTVEFTLAKADIVAAQSNGTIDSNDRWYYAEPGRDPVFNTNLCYRANGWTAAQISEVMVLQPGALDAYRLGRITDRDCFTVTRIMQDGTDVAKVTGPGTYTLTVECDGSKTKFFTSSAPFEVTLNVKASPMQVTSIGVKGFDKIELASKEYRYTGDPVAPKLAVLDGAGDPVDLDFPLIWTKGQAPTAAGQYNVPDYDNPDAQKKDQYPDLWITGDGVHYGQNLNPAKTTNKIYKAVPGIVDLSFSIVAADIADASQVRVKVNDEDLHAHDGVEARPTVTFYDAATGAQLNFSGEDYTLSYRNNVDAGSPASENPPTVIITPSDDANNKNLSVNGDTSGATGLEVPFTIKGDGRDVSDVAWDYASTIVVGQDGTLSAPGVIGALDGKQVDAASYQVETGVYDQAAFTAKDAGWAAGDAAYLRVTGVKEGVLQGTALLGPIQVVEAGDANTFKDASATFKAQAADTTYTALGAKPAVTVTNGGAPLVEGRDFKVECADRNAGPATVTVVGLGAYAGSMHAGFAIAPARMDDVTARVAGKTYTARQITPDASDVNDVALDGVPLPADDWAVQADGFGANVNVKGGGTLTLAPGASGNLTGTKELPFDIIPAPLVNDQLEVKVKGDGLAYTGENVRLTAQDLAITDTLRNKELVFGEDYVIAGYADNLNVGTATAYVTGAGNYSASDNAVTVPFAIKAADFSQAEIAGVDASYDFRGAGKPVQPRPVVKLGGVALPEFDYEVSYGANDVIGVGTGSVTVAPKGSNVTGDAKTATFDIAVDLAKATVETIPNGTYEPGGAYEPDVKVSYNGAPLEEGVHYRVAYDDGNAGRKTLVVSGIGPCTGTQEVSYGIDGKPLADGMVSAELDGLTYTGSAVEPEVTLKDGAYALVEGVDFELSYGNNVNATAEGAPAAITIAGKGNYAGVLTKTFAIQPKQLTDSDIAVAAAASGLFSGSAVGADVTATDAGFVPDPQTGAAYVLSEGVDYELACTDNAAVGTATATLTGKGNYAGTVNATYAVKGDLAAAQAAALPGATYTGAALTPSPTLTLAGVTLEEGVDYTAAYEDNVRPGTARVTLTGTGSYEGVQELTFSIKEPSYVDAATGVTVSGTALVDLAQDGATVDVVVKALHAGDAAYDEAHAAYAADAADAFTGYAVEVHVVKDGVTTVVKEGLGALTVSLPVDAAYDGRAATLAVRHTADGGAVDYEVKRVRIADGAAAVTVDRLSEFFVAVDKVASDDNGGPSDKPDDSVEPGGSQGGAKDTAPAASSGKTFAATGDGAPLIAIGLAALAAAALMFMAFLAMRRKADR